jgi:predicted RNA-binding protein with RPS1 domain
MSSNPAADSPDTNPQTPEATTAPAIPAGDASSAATPAPADAPAATPATPSGPNLRGLPTIKKAMVVSSEGEEAPPFGGRPRSGGGGGGGGGFGGGGGGRPGQRGPKPDDQREKGPDTRGTLQSVSDDSRNMMDDFAPGELDALLKGSTDRASAAAQAKIDATKRAHAHDVEVRGGRAPAAVRGPRVVQSGREHRTGKIVSVGPSDIFVEFGPKELGVVSRLSYKDDELPVVGTELEVVVERFNAEESLFMCARPGAVTKAAWELLEVGQVVEARVTGVNKGGLELEVANHRAFMPSGQVALERIEDMSVFVGEKFACKVTKLDRRGMGDIVLSRRDILQEERKVNAEKIKSQLVEGAVMEGTVRKVMPFGAFVDLGGVDGLVHIENMTYDRVIPTEKNVQKYCKEGEKVKVQLLKVDLENNRIALGMKQLSQDPFETATSEIKEGAEITGTVVRLTEFGAFIQIAAGVDGLLHVSEISRKRIDKPEQVLKKDQVITARVIKIDPSTRRISLSMKVLEADTPPAPGSREAIFAEKRQAKEKQMAERLAEISKETPELRRKREQFRNKDLTGGFGKKIPGDSGNNFGLTLGQR